MSPSPDGARLLPEQLCTPSHQHTCQRIFCNTSGCCLCRFVSVVQVGNGDVICVSSALRLLQETGCDGIMIGRGALQDPLLFHRIRTHFNTSGSPNTLHQQAGRQCQDTATQQPHVQQPCGPELLPGVPYNHQQHTATESLHVAGVLQMPEVPHGQQPPEASCHADNVDEAAVVADFLQLYAACGQAEGPREPVRLTGQSAVHTGRKCLRCQCKIGGQSRVSALGQGFSGQQACTGSRMVQGVKLKPLRLTITS